MPEEREQSHNTSSPARALELRTGSDISCEQTLTLRDCEGVLGCLTQINNEENVLRQKQAHSAGGELPTGPGIPGHYNLPYEVLV